jgi:hypothetical protein
MKKADYLTDPFTVEYDTYMPGDGYPINLFFKTAGSANDFDATVSIHSEEADYENNTDGKSFSMNGKLPDVITADNYKNKWHHIAMAYKNNQLKLYVDQ